MASDCGISYGFRKISARIDDRLIAPSDDGYVAVTLPRDEPNWKTRGYFLEAVSCQALPPLQNQIGDRHQPLHNGPDGFAILADKRQRDLKTLRRFLRSFRHLAEFDVVKQLPELAGEVLLEVLDRMVGRVEVAHCLEFCLEVFQRLQISRLRGLQ